MALPWGVLQRVEVVRLSARAVSGTRRGPMLPEGSSSLDNAPVPVHQLGILAAAGW
jgi:hypothetical protein